MHKNKLKRLSYYIGNALIALSFFCTIFIYFPLITAYFFPSSIPIASGQNSITIPRINAQAPVLFNVDPWNEKEYKEALQKGVAHAKGTSKPGERGTIYIFAHSSDLPWRITRYNTIFLHLGDLQENDLIMLSNNGIEYTYKVTGKKTVSPYDIQYLINAGVDQLIVQTCTPIGTDWKRLLVFAKPV